MCWKYMELVLLCLGWKINGLRIAEPSFVTWFLFKFEKYKLLARDQIPAQLVQTGDSWNNEELSQQWE